MNTYTKEDTKDLFSRIDFFRVFMGTNPKKTFEQFFITDFEEFLQLNYLNDIYAYITIKEGTTLLNSVLLLKIINETLSNRELFNFNISLNNNRLTKDAIEEFNYIVKKAPLDQVPLNLSSFPEIAAWRLRIGK